MSRVLLSFSSPRNVRGGVEVFSSHLKSTFNDLEIIDFFRARKKLGKRVELAPVREVQRARLLNKFFETVRGEIKPELVFTNGMFGAFLKKSPVPVVNIQHGGYAAFADSAMKKSTLNYYRVKYIYAHFERRSALNSNLVVSNSNFTRKSIKQYYGIKSRVIFNAVDPGLFKPIKREKARESLNISTQKPVVLFVGRADYSKGFDIVLEIARRMPSVLFLCVLSSSYEPGLGNVVVRQNVLPEKLPEYYSASDAVLFPSRFEGFGFVTVESLACNTPVITSNTGIASEIMTEGLYRINGFDWNAYSKKLEEVLDSREKTNSRHFIKKNYSLRVFSRNYRELSRELVG